MAVSTLLTLSMFVSVPVSVSIFIFIFLFFFCSCSCNMLMQHVHEARTHTVVRISSMAMLNGHVTWICKMDMQHGHAWTRSMGHAAGTRSLDIRHGHAECACSKGMPDA